VDHNVWPVEDERQKLKLCCRTPVRLSPSPSV